MDDTSGQWSINQDDQVYGADGDEIGKVIDVTPEYIVVEKGFFFPTDYYIPIGLIGRYEQGRVYLAITKEEALEQGSDTVPTRAATDVTPLETNPFGTDEPVRVPLHREELIPVRREREIGDVQIAKEVIAEQRVLEVPVAEERIRVSRRPVDREVAPGEEVFEEGIVADIPIRGEEVALLREAHVTEEVEIAKEAVQRVERVAGVVRREEVHVAGEELLMPDQVATAEATTTEATTTEAEATEAATVAETATVEAAEPEVAAVETEEDTDTVVVVDEDEDTTAEVVTEDEDAAAETPNQTRRRRRKRR